MKIKNKISFYGIIILILFFISFYFVTTFFLDRIKPSKEVEENIPSINENDNNYSKIYDHYVALSRAKVFGFIFKVNK